MEAALWHNRVPPAQESGRSAALRLRGGGIKAMRVHRAMVERVLYALSLAPAITITTVVLMTCGANMRVGVGYSDNPDTAAAGEQAAREALLHVGTAAASPCDLILLFATARHDAKALRKAVSDVVGSSVPIVGGGAVGAICNDRFGYAGDQVALAAFWLDGARCDIIAEGGLDAAEDVEAGKRLGRKLGRLGTAPDSPVLLFYNAMESDQNTMRMVMATYLLEGIQQSLGFLPDIMGAGLQGDYLGSSSCQWTGADVAEHQALALLFGGDVRVDHTIMHGCKPATGYYTVTRADKQTVLEINGQPALDFVDTLLESSIPREAYPFFLIFGVNKGEKWGPTRERLYVNRLCLGLDEKRNGLVMFEPDLVEGTEFQIMYRSLDLGYVAPKIERLFADSEVDRKPVFALYIDCAGRAAGYGGMDMEDAVVVQKTVAGRVPLLGIYSGVEIASVGGAPRGLDWTGVFCLFSVPK